MPPPNETPAARALRERQEAEAQRTSDKIDEQIRAERAAMKKKEKGIVRVLLLGQSESGKSTTLKNFRMKYARSAWKQERASWRAVIQLNLLRSINTILDVMQAEMDGEPVDGSNEEPRVAEQGMITTGIIDDSMGGGPRTPISPATPTSPSTPSMPWANTPFGSTVSLSRPSGSSSTQTSPIDSTLTNQHQLLKLRLGPLRRVEFDLRRRLGAGADEDYGSNTEASFGVLGTVTNTARGTLISKRSRSEFGVRKWKDALENGQQVMGRWHARARSSELGHDAGSAGGASGAGDEATEVIASCREDMKSLWMDAAVRGVLKKRKMRLEDSAGFFLNDLDRIATRAYEPSDDDVVRARLRTLGVQEHRIHFEQPMGQSQLFPGSIADFGREWVLYDVGGSRTIRHAWVPFFDNVNAIIFLAPISCFDERLLEDSRVNRLEDSFLLWRTVCSSKLLSRTTLILFLNKCDLLRRKLRSGVLVKNYLPSFGNRPNDPPTVVKYLKEKFRDISKQYSPEPRVTYYYPTSVTDTKATAATLQTVRDAILLEHLKSADFV
ncbi:guanine nucleotide binding protein, alpha subunit [Crucibulum laeve]|uniref:Guanine nucleotide binding protein, alpha subunit n=1 Tax=Crucibulum laeve TaxID=68775 RepID=A0A5C3LSR8_9AGAR|nr:guanine nucleotide binding protein, alpha subunit [Crucibulum laeve]